VHAIKVLPPVPPPVPQKEKVAPQFQSQVDMVIPHPLQVMRVVIFEPPPPPGQMATVGLGNIAYNIPAL
jgi:hypothetical protein